MNTPQFGGGILPPPIGPQSARGCEECNRSEPKPWPIYTVNYHGEEVCAKCLTPMRFQRKGEK